MPSVVVLGVPGEELSHDGGRMPSLPLLKSMDVIVHEDPGIDGTLSIGDVLPQAFQETGHILIVSKDVGFVEPLHHHMVQGAGNIQSRLAGQGTFL